MSDDLFGDVFSLSTPSRAPAPASSASSASGEGSLSQLPAAAPAEEPTPPVKVASLAEVVRELRARQRGVEALVLRAARSIDTSERQGMHRAVGLDDMASFVDQSLGEGSLLRELLARARTAGLQPSPRKRARGGRRAAKPKQGKRENADASFERACTFVSSLRALEQELRERIAQSKGLLGEIERDELFREGGYASFEDFLDRAIGASPVFGTTLMLLGDELPDMAPAPERTSRLTMPVDSYEFVLTSLPAPAMPGGGSGSAKPAAPVASVAPVASAATSPRGPTGARLSPTFAIVISAVVAIAVGSVAGILSSPHGSVADAAPAVAHHDEAAPEPSAEPSAEAPAEPHREGAPTEPAAVTPTPSPLPGPIGVRPSPLGASRRAAREAAPESAAAALPTVSPLPGFRVADK